MTSAPGAASSTGQPDGGPGAVIRTINLTKVYPGTDFTAVDSLNLAVQRGEIFGSSGPNGAGKTTTAGMLTTRVIPTSGQAIVGGIDVVAHPALAKQVIGVVTQQNTLDRALTVWENLYYHGRLVRHAQQGRPLGADQLLEQFHLSNWGRSSVFALSGGMAQRLMVARARSCTSRTSCSSTSPPRAWTRRAGSRCGRSGRVARRGPDHPPDHPLHGRGRPAVRSGWPSWTMGKSWPSTRPPV